MKMILIILQFGYYNIGFGQNLNYEPQYFLRQMFFDSISKVEFLYKLRYTDFQCKGFTITLNNPEVDPKEDLTIWTFKQNFHQYLDSSSFEIVHEGIANDSGFHYEYFKIFDKKKGVFLRQIMASYEINSNKMIAIMDSEIHL